MHSLWPIYSTPALSVTQKRLYSCSMRLVALYECCVPLAMPLPLRNQNRAYRDFYIIGIVRIMIIRYHYYDHRSIYSAPILRVFRILVTA